MLQYFLEQNKKSVFEHDRLPRLLYLCNTETMQQNFPRVLHKHEDRLEIVFIVKGRGKHLIGKTNYQTKEGDILIFNQNVLHDETAELNSDMVVYCCGIKDLHIKGMDKNCLFDSAAVVLPSGNKRKIIEKTLDMMWLHITENPHHADENCRYLLASLLALIIRLPRQNIITLTYHKPTVIEQVKDYIDLHYADDLSLTNLACRFNMNPYYLAHLFKRQIGFSPIQYMIRRRIGEAQSLLINTHHSITRIATLVGYTNANYFSTLFSNMIGVSPTAYRASWVGKPQ